MRDDHSTRLLRPTTIFLIGSALSIAIATAAGLWQSHSNQITHDERYAELTQEFANLVSNRFHLYQYGLRGARGAVVAGGGTGIKRETFVNYIKTRDQFTEFPGARGIGFIARVASREVADFVSAAKADRFASFSVRELSPNTGERFIIKYIYPLTGNEGATGLDIASESNRRSAAEDAARTGEARLTAPITLVQASGETNHGFLILMPVYKTDAQIRTPKERLAANFGWSYSPLIVSEVLADLGPRRDEIAFSITDTNGGIEFYKSPGFKAQQVISDRQIDVFGRHWTINFHSQPKFLTRLTSVKPLPLAITLGIVGIMLTVASYGFAQNSAQKWQLRREEEDFAYKIVDAAPQALLVVDDAGVIIRANSYCERVFGWKPEELAGRSVEDLVQIKYRDKHQGHRASYDYTRRDMGDQRELEATRSDGTNFPILVRLSPLLIDERKLVVAGIIDVSAEREAISVLTASQQRWQEVANSLPQLVWTCDSSGNCDFLSAQWVTYTGAPAKLQLGNAWLDKVHPDDIAHLTAEWTKSIETGTPFAVEFRIRRHDGVYRLFYTRAEPIRDANGNVERWIGSNTDIEDRHQAELKVHGLLEELEDRVSERTDALNTALRDLQNILDALPSLIAYWDSNLRNRFANRAYKQWFDVSTEWLKDRHMSELLNTELYEKNTQYIEGALNGEAQMFERDLMDTKGEPHTNQIHYLPDIADGKVLGFYVIVFDVTSIKASEQAQKEARVAAESATRAKSAFLTSMSHELRTPMNSILGFADLLVSKHFGPLNEKQFEHASLIRSSGEHLLKLMDDVLELSKIEAGRVSASIEPVNLTIIVKSVISNLEVLAGKFKIEIRTGNTGNGYDLVMADTTRLTQILTNLGSNAIKYNRPGGWVEFSYAIKPDGNTWIAVSDNGLGIPKEQQNGAFQPFNRMGAEQGKIEGTGIGLALVKNYAELMGGRVDFESTEGEGSTFWVKLPSVSADDLEKEKSIGITSTRSLSASSQMLRVLYIEDNEINRSLFRFYMEAIKNIELLEAEDGPSGLSAARAERPDLIFLDINLPGMNGYDVLQEIRADPLIKDTIVIALTANAMSGDVERGLGAGFDDYLAKPVRLQGLEVIIAEVRTQIDYGK